MAATSSQGEGNATLWMWLLEKGEEGSEEDREEGGAWEKLWGCAARQGMGAGQEKKEEKAFVSPPPNIPFPGAGGGGGAGEGDAGAGALRRGGAGGRAGKRGRAGSLCCANLLP